MSTPILLCTLNARYLHCAFGLRYLYANLGELQSEARILEFTINQNPRDMAEAILAHDPQIVGLGVYIWNAQPTRELVSLLKRLRPELKIVLGGPEVSYETAEQELCQLADLTVQGEGDTYFRELCHGYLLDGQWPAEKAIRPHLPEVTRLALPYSHYSDEDLRHRVLYVEASRGCPYKCEYCLSSLDKSVRNFPVEGFLAEMQGLIDRGARQFKFVDRTFNLSPAISQRILTFFLERMELGLFLHFEMVPDRLPPELRQLICQFPPGALQFEVGIQTWNPEVARLVSRRQDYGRIADNFAYLREIGNVHVHADLIAGLPGETPESFARGFDAVAELGPEEIQLGILKRLRGTPIIRHDQEWAMVYQDRPPYQVLQTRTMTFNALQEIGRFSHFWDQIANSGNFRQTLILIRELGQHRPAPSFYDEFAELARFLGDRHPQGHGVALLSIVESVWLYLTQQKGISIEKVRPLLAADYTGLVKRDLPRFLRPPADETPPPSVRRKQPRPPESAIPRRQQRHLSP